MTKTPKLTTREAEIFQHIAQSYTTHQSADRLGISPRTVQVHRNNIRLKLGLDRSSQLYVFAGRNGR
jgi:DNA-binding CsgD family transcriptional regulator